MENLSKIDTAKDLVTKEWVEAQDFLPSSAFTKNGIKNALGIADWALAASKPSYNFSEIGSKPTTLSGYGITDAAKAGFRFDSIQTGDVNIIGWVEIANNWKGQGAGMLIGQKNYYTRINITGDNDAPTMYLSRIHSGVAYDWVKVLTEKNIGSHAMSIRPADSSNTGPKPTDYDAFATYAYAANGWYASGPALAFPHSNYKALIQMVYGPSNAYMRMLISGARPEVSGNVLPWTEVVTAANIANYAVAMKTYQTNINLDEIGLGFYDLTGSITNSPINYGSLLNIKGYFSAQLLFNHNGNALYYRTKSDSELNGSKWRDWRTILDTNNIGDYAMSKAGGTIDGNLTINGEFKTQTTLGHVSLFSNIFEVNASLKVLSGWALYLNGKGIQQWSDLGTYITPISSETTSAKTISPNTFYKWGSVSALSITLGAATNNTHINNYMFEFTASTGFTLGGLSGVKWADGVKPNIKAGYTYQFSIINNCATYSAFKTA